jgi:hypothetical protein
MKKYTFILMVLALVFMLGQPDQLPRKARSGHDLRNNHNRLLNLGAIERIYTDELEEEMIECVDCPHRFSKITDRSLRLDPLGYPHIAYGKRHLYYAWYDGEAWQNETVDNSAEVGQYASIDLDRDGFPHISYYDLMNGALKYAYRDMDGWHIQTVDIKEDGSDVNVGVFTSLDLDEEGFPHITYATDPIAYATTSINDLVDIYNLKYAYQDDSGWHIQTVDSEGSAGRPNSMVLDKNGFPHISYMDQKDNTLKYAFQDQNGWNIQVVAGGFHIGSISLVLDLEGHPHVCYSLSSYKSGTLYYGYMDVDGWHIQAVDSGDVGYGPSLILDRDGFAHISYGADYAETLRYAFQDGGGWHIQTVLSETMDVGGGWKTSLALDENGNAHIIYLDRKGELMIGEDYLYNLNYAIREVDGWYIHTVDREGDVGFKASIALDENGYPHISYQYAYESDYYDLRYAFKDDIGWHTETVDNDGQVGLHTSIGLDSDGHPHISYFDEINSDLKYAYKDETGWHTQIVDIDGDTSKYDKHISLSIDSDGYPHISYSHYNLNALKYAYLDASGWQIESLDAGGKYSVAMDMDKYGNPHIGFITPNGLEYTYQNEEGWQNQMVDTDASHNSFLSMSLDGDGNPHFSYLQNGMLNLKYAYQDSTGWTIQIVDRDEGEFYKCTSLGLDREAIPHIGYGALNLTQKYAHQTMDGWQIQNLDVKSSCSTMALSKDGSPQFVFTDVYNPYSGEVSNDLMYISFQLYNLNLRPVVDWEAGPPGSTVTYSLQLTNTGQVTDTFNIAATSYTWPTAAPISVGPLVSDESVLVEVSVSIPSDAPIGTTDKAIITFTSQGDNSQTATAILNTISGNLFYYLPLVEK